MSDNSRKQEGEMAYYTTEEVAAILKLSPATLEKWRLEGGKLEFVKLGRAVRYPEAAVKAFMARNTRTSTSQSK